jgi:hypothetical protein
MPNVKEKKDRRRRRGRKRGKREREHLKMEEWRTVVFFGRFWLVDNKVLKLWSTMA